MSTSLYVCTVYKKVGGDMFCPLQPREPIAEVDTFTIKAFDPAGAAEMMFQVGQKEFCNDEGGKAYPRDVNSVSVGDLIKVANGARHLWFFAVAPVGMTDIPEPTNPVVPLGGTIVTSRPATTEGATTK